MKFAPDPFKLSEKMSRINDRFRVLVIHGDEDVIIPCHHGRSLHRACGCETKILRIFSQKGHNNIAIENDEYFALVQSFIKDTEFWKSQDFAEIADTRESSCRCC